MALGLLMSGPGCGDDDSAPADPAPVRSAPKEEKDDDGEALRAKSLAQLKEAGFAPPNTLPTRLKRPGVVGKLRPLHEIGGRVMALKAVIAWSSVPEAQLPSELIKAYVKRSGLTRYLNETEREILGMRRGAAIIGHAPEAAWRRENLWALSWILGYEQAPPFAGQRIDNERGQTLVNDFVVGYSGDLKGFLRGATVRGEAEVSALEDVFYCAHAAARAAAKLPGAAPKAFDSVADGGAIHERRHALTWALSPGTAWDQTDLTT